MLRPMTKRNCLLIACLVSACARDVGTSPAQTDAPASAQNQAAHQAATDKTQLASNASHASHAEGGAHAGCIYAGGEASGAGVCGQQEPDAPTQSTGHFGAPFSTTASIPLTKAIGDAKPGAVLVSGTVEAVCQKKGCWMVVKDGTLTARVMMKDHAFAVPVDSRGKAVLVEGELTTRTFNEQQVKHLEQDKGGDPSAVQGERKEHVLMATAVEIGT
jgi:hypothetical protein